MKFIEKAEMIVSGNELPFVDFLYENPYSYPSVYMSKY